VIKPGTVADKTDSRTASRPCYARLEPVVGRGSVTRQRVGGGGAVLVSLGGAVGVSGLLVGRGGRVVGRGGLLVGRGGLVVGRGGLGVLYGGGAVAVDSRGAVLSLISNCALASKEKVGEDGGFQKGDLAEEQAVDQSGVGDGREGNGAQGEEGLGVRLGGGGPSHHEGEGCEGEDDDLGRGALEAAH